MRGVDAILVSSKEILDATDTGSGTINHRPHRDLGFIHVMLKHLSFNGVSKYIFRALSFRLVKSYHTSNIGIFVRGHHVRVESEYIMVTNAVGDAVPVQATAEYHGSGGILLLVLIQNWRTGKSEEQRVWERATDILQHVAEGGTMAFVHNKDDTSCS